MERYIYLRIKARIKGELFVLSLESFVEAAANVAERPKSPTFFIRKVLIIPFCKVDLNELSKFFILWVDSKESGRGKGG